MIKIKRGSYTNLEGVTKDIVVKSAAPNKLKDILIGGGMVLAGLVYLTTSAFKNGCEKLEEAEVETMRELNIIKDEITQE